MFDVPRRGVNEKWRALSPCCFAAIVHGAGHVRRDWLRFGCQSPLTTLPKILCLSGGGDYKPLTPKTPLFPSIRSHFFWILFWLHVRPKPSPCIR